MGYERDLKQVEKFIRLFVTFCFLHTVLFLVCYVRYVRESFLGTKLFRLIYRYIFSSVVYKNSRLRESTHCVIAN